MLRACPPIATLERATSTISRPSTSSGRAIGTRPSTARCANARAARPRRFSPRMSKPSSHQCFRPRSDRQATWSADGQANLQISAPGRAFHDHGERILRWPRGQNLGHRDGRTRQGLQREIAVVEAGRPSSFAAPELRTRASKIDAAVDREHCRGAGPFPSLVIRTSPIEPPIPMQRQPGFPIERLPSAGLSAAKSPAQSSARMPSALTQTRGPRTE